MVTDKRYIITSCSPDGEKLYWNNLHGWGDAEGAQFFSQYDKDTLRLPIDGEWEEVL